MILLLQLQEVTLKQLFIEQPVSAVMLVVSLLNPFWGHLIYHIFQEGQKKKCKGEKILNFFLSSQLIVGNIVLAILALLTKLNLSLDPKSKPLTPSETIIVSALLFSIVFSGNMLLRVLLSSN
ncbi:hypothetical protein ABE096_09200 [Robertmurraya massiliosenegalensis]|uniref:hypothetical protein n=1 Tax=Robertmurraya massiliosenegalensis TaxID=1287657 RepID=UPI003D2D43DB